MKWFAWLLPGLRLKRWLGLFALGLLLFATGWGLVLQGPVLTAVVTWSDSVWRRLTGHGLVPSLAGTVFATLGALIMTGAAGAGYRSLLHILTPAGSRVSPPALIRRRWAERGPRVVAIGGGTGLATLVRGLKRYTSNITAIVTVTDDGGSSGRLVGELGMLPPGDVRNVLVALADTEPLMERLFQHRFRQGSLRGHSFGNLLIGALTEILGDFEQAVHTSSQVLAVRGQVLPSTTQRVRLCAEMDDGRRICGETQIVAARGVIRRVYLDPPTVRPVPAALRALSEADLIVLGPGSLYTSVLPNLLIPDLADAVRRSPAVKVYVVNVMTQPGETDGYTAADHVRALVEHAGRDLVRYALVNTGVPAPSRLAAYRVQGAHPVKPDLAEIRRLDLVPVTADLIADGDLVRHDSERLAAALLKLLLEQRLGRPRRLLADLWLSRRLRRVEVR